MPAAKWLPPAGLALVLLAASEARAQTGVEIEVDKHIVTVGEPVRVTVRIGVEGREGYDHFEPPAMPGFESAGSTMTSQNMEIVNWQIRLRETRVYRAIPLKTGRLTIGPASIRVGRRVIHSERVAIEVKPGEARPAPAPAPGTPAAPAPSPPPGSGRGRSTVFLHVTAVPPKVYVGQQVLAQWRLFTRGLISGYQPLRQPTTDHFWAEDLSPKRLDYDQQVVDGRAYYSAVVLRQALFPDEAGTHTVGPLVVRVRTVDQIFGSAVERQSDPLEIEVLALPAQGKPAGFSPSNVGQYQLAATLERNRVKAGEAVQLKVVVRGQGNLRQLKVPELPAIEGVKTYDPKVSERIEERSDGIFGEKLVEYLLLPQKAGRLNIPALHLDFFDPYAERYQRASTAPLTLEVVGTVAEGNRGAAGAAAGRQNVLGRDIRPPRPAGALHDREPFAFFEGLTLWLFVLPLGLLVTVVVSDWVRARMRRETARSLSRAAGRRARQHLRRAEQSLDRGDAAAVFAQVASAIDEQLSDRLGRRVEGMTRDELRDALAARGVEEGLRDALVAELDNCDFGRFTPAARSPDQLKQALERGRKLVQAVARASLRGPQPSGGGR